MAQGGNEHRALLRAMYARWLKHRTILEAYRVRPGDRRTTPPPACDVEELFPELSGLFTTTVRLHPRYGDEPPMDASKLGGMFLWPAEEPWPVCSEHAIPLVTVMQLRAADFPEMPFPPGADLFQVLWCPRDHDFPEYQGMDWVDPKFFWRNRQEIAHAREDNPSPQEAYYDYVPFTCRLLPERVIEYPFVGDLPGDLAERIEKWEDQNLVRRKMNVFEHACEYEGELSVAYGTKIGGYPLLKQAAHSGLNCKCGRPMEHLLTIASMEWDGVGDRRWTPVEEQAIFASFRRAYDEWGEEHNTIFGALWNPTGINLGDAGHMQLFVCRHCLDWSIVPIIECQ
jgi:hypothetical protein